MELDVITEKGRYDDQRNQGMCLIEKMQNQRVILEELGTMTSAPYTHCNQEYKGGRGGGF